MRKTILSIFLAGALLFAGISVAKAQSVEELQTKIKALLEQIQTLQNQVQVLRQQLQQQPRTPSLVVPEGPKKIIPPDQFHVPRACELPQAVAVGLKGDDIKILQRLLAEDKNVYPEGYVTGYFGNLSELALKRFQEKNNLPATGVLDDVTRKLLQEKLSEISSRWPECPVVVHPPLPTPTPLPLPTSTAPYDLGVKDAELNSTGVAATFCNYGAAVSSFPVHINLNGIVRTFDLAGVREPSACQRHSWAYGVWGITYEPVKYYYATIAVDPLGIYRETNEENNKIFVSAGSPTTSCPGPYHVIAPDGRCVWSCSEGTTPDNVTNQCICKPGYTESGTDAFGRRICTAPVAVACTDSDGGKNISLRGTCVGANNTGGTDYCNPYFNAVEEFYCPAATGECVRATGVECPSGTACSSGICVPKTTEVCAGPGLRADIYGGPEKKCCEGLVLEGGVCNVPRETSAVCTGHGLPVAYAPAGQACCAGLTVQNGYCLPPPGEPILKASCTDTDGGRNASVWGKVSGGSYGTIGYNHGSFADYCNPYSGKVVEYFCVAGDYVQFNEIECSTGTVCSAGACVPQTSAPAGTSGAPLPVESSINQLGSIIDSTRSILEQFLGIFDNR